MIGRDSSTMSFVDLCVCRPTKMRCLMRCCGFSSAVLGKFHLLTAAPAQMKRFINYASGVTMTTDRYGGVMLDLSAVNEGTDPDLVIEHIRDAVSTQSAAAPAAWVRLPLHLSSLAASLAIDGFRYHHAEGYYASLVKWLRPDRPSKVPRFGTHQLGVAGLLIDDDSLLCVREHRPSPSSTSSTNCGKSSSPSPWKLPGGVADLGEEIGEAATREVAEETGLQSRFESVLAFRHHHRHPMAFNRSDFYVLCRLSLANGSRDSQLVRPCPDEISKAEWLSVSQLESLPQAEVAPVLRAALPLVKLGLQIGFESVEMRRFDLFSIYTARRVSLYHRPLDVVS